MKISTKVTVHSNRQQWDKMAKRLLHGSGKRIQVGWWGDYHPSGPAVAQIAAWNEEGHVNGGMFAGTITPPRPFIRMGFLPQSQAHLKNTFKDIHKIAMGTMSWSTYYRNLGRDYVELMQKTILEWKSPPNSTVTVYMKGFNNPLVETGYMQSKVKYKITARGST